MSKKWYVIIICVLSFGAFGFAAEKTPDTDCFQLVLGEIVQLKTNVVSDSTNKIRAFAYIRMARDVKYAREGMACTVHYDLYVSKNGAEFHSVKSLARKFGDTVGATIIGFSEDESKLAADFWWAAGDYTAHKPVIYDVDSGKVAFGELGEQIDQQLGECSHPEELVGVTNEGEAIIHVHENVHVDEGCPDQGEWLFDLTTSTARRR